jgi:acyl-coenzyme A thioesterase PaaI-like protein
MLDSIDAALRANPFLATLGVHTVEARPGYVKLRIRNTPHLTSDGGRIATGVLFALAETSAQIVVRTQPSPNGGEPRQTSGRIKYYCSIVGDVTATAVCEIPADPTHVLSRMDVQVTLGSEMEPKAAEFTARFALPPA